MKRFIAIAVLAVVVVSLFAASALAAGPVGGRWARGTAQQSAPQTPFTGCPMGGAGGMGMMGGAAWAGQPDEVATLLGMTAEQIQAERQAGKSLAQIAASKGVSEEKLIETILAAKKAALQEAVTAGKLTQAQADLMLDHMDDMVKLMVERTTTGPMMGGRGMMGGGMRGQGRGMMGQGLGQSY